MEKFVEVSPLSDGKQDEEVEPDDRNNAGEEDVDEAAALSKCTNVQLVDSWSSNPDACVPEDTFGCANDSKHMWTKGECSGMFSVDGMPTRCGQPLDSVQGYDKTQLAQMTTCEAGHMPTPEAECQQMFLSSYFTSVRDWQSNRHVIPFLEDCKTLSNCVGPGLEHDGCTLDPKRTNMLAIPNCRLIHGCGNAFGNWAGSTTIGMRLRLMQA